MPTNDRVTPELLDVVACDIAARPKAAPSIIDLAPHIQRVERTGSLRITFASAAAEQVTQFVDAERLCCASIDWQLSHDPACVVLTIGATPAQLDAMEQMFTGT